MNETAHTASVAQEWLCSGCGIETPKRLRVCACPTSCLYRVVNDQIEHNVKKPSYAYDSKCLDLAEHFIAGEEGADADDKADLAQHIQEAIEDWIGDRAREQARAAISKATAPTA